MFLVYTDPPRGRGAVIAVITHTDDQSHMLHLELPELPTRPPDSHKGSFGHAFLIGGATGMTGAIAIAGMACLRTGAGLVTLGIPECNQPLVASLDPNSMTLALPSDSEGRLGLGAAAKMSGLLRRVKCVAIGPGLGRSHDSDAIVGDLFAGRTRIIMQRPTVKFV